MGEVYHTWLKMAQSEHTQNNWRNKWSQFTKWVTESGHLNCNPYDIDNVIMDELDSLEYRKWHRKYKNIISMYLAYIVRTPTRNGKQRTPNSVSGQIMPIRSFFTRMTDTQFKFTRGDMPSPTTAKNEHIFSQRELCQMYQYGNIEDRARLSLVVSTGFANNDTRTLTVDYIRQVLVTEDSDGFCAFDRDRRTTGKRQLMILNPLATRDVKAYLETIPDDQERFWSIINANTFDAWFKKLYERAHLNGNGTIRFHLLRKYVFSNAVSLIGLNEARLLTGKKIPVEEATYLTSLRSRTIQRYKERLYSVLRLDHLPEVVNGRTKKLEETTSEQQSEIELLKQEIAELKQANHNSKAYLNNIDDFSIELLRILDGLKDENPEVMKALVKAMSDRVKFLDKFEAEIQE